MVAMGMFADERVELLEGALVELAPAGPAEASAVARLKQRLGEALAERAEIRVQAPLAASELSEPAPDLAVVERGDYSRQPPTAAYLIVEVGERSLEEELELKPRVYASAGVEEYWVVDLARRRVEIFREPEANGFTSRRTAVSDEVLSPARFPDVTVPVAELVGR